MTMRCPSECGRANMKLGQSWHQAGVKLVFRGTNDRYKQLVCLRSLLEAIPICLHCPVGNTAGKCFQEGLYHTWLGEGHESGHVMRFYSPRSSSQEHETLCPLYRIPLIRDQRPASTSCSLTTSFFFATESKVDAWL